MVQEHWTSEFYRRIDAMDPAAGEFWSDDVYLQCGNHPPTKGKEAAAFGPFRRIVEAMTGIKHEMLDRWDISANEVIFRFIVHYDRRDGRRVSLPAVTTIRRNVDGLINDLRLYMDAAPLFEGLSARLVGSVSIPIDTREPPEGSRQALLREVKRYAANPERYDPEITSCKIVVPEKGSGDKVWLIREVVLDDQEVQELVSLANDDRLTITRARSEQRGDIHLIVANSDQKTTLSLQFDLSWDGVPAESVLVEYMRERLLQRGRALVGAIVAQAQRADA